MQTPRSRREILRATFGLVASATAGRILTACGGANESPRGTSPTTGDDLRILKGTGVPDHPTGVFPNPGCPNPIAARERMYAVPRTPRMGSELTPLNFFELGLAVSGVVFDPSGPSYRGDDTSGWMFDVAAPKIAPYLGLDMQYAHVQPDGSYHYHAFSPALRERSRGKMMQLGWAADGFPIYGAMAYANAKDPASPLVALRPSYRLKDGPRPSASPGGSFDGTFVADYAFEEGLGDLDEANGRFGVTPEFPDGTYYYVLTEAFPYMPRFFRGTPHQSFGTHTRGPGMQGTPPPLRDWRP